MSQLMVDLCQLLKVKHLKVKHRRQSTTQFNQKLKRMLRKKIVVDMVDEKGWNWDLLLFYVLFTILENP